MKFFNIIAVPFLLALWFLPQNAAHNYSTRSGTGTPSASANTGELYNQTDAVAGLNLWAYNGALVKQTGGAYALLMFAGANHSPADSTTYYFGLGQNTPVTSAQTQKYFFPKSGTVTRCDITVAVGGTLGTTEASTFNFRLNDTTNTELSAAVTMDTAYQTFNVTGLSIAVVAGNYAEVQIVTPMWVTNPTNVRYYASLFIE